MIDTNNSRNVLYKCHRSHLKIIGTSRFIYLYLLPVNIIESFIEYHRQRGSDCTVLTATGLVNGEYQILTPYRIETPKPIDKKICIRDYVRETTPYAFWCKSIHGGLLGK